MYKSEMMFASKTSDYEKSHRRRKTIWPNQKISVTAKNVKCTYDCVVGGHPSSGNLTFPMTGRTHSESNDM